MTIGAHHRYAARARTPAPRPVQDLQGTLSPGERELLGRLEAERPKRRKYLTAIKEKGQRG